MLVNELLGPLLTRAPLDVADAGRLERLADLEGLVAKHERRLAEAQVLATAVADFIKRLDAGVEVPEAAQRDAAAELLLAKERSYAEGLQRLLPLCKQNEARAAETAPVLLPLFQRITDLVGEELRLSAEMARDLRWALLVLQAEGEPPADGPILSTPAKVHDFFRSRALLSDARTVWAPGP